MPAQTNGLGAAPAVDRGVSIEIEDAALAKIGLDGDELQGSGLPSPASSQTSVNPNRAGDITAIGWLSLQYFTIAVPSNFAAAEILVHGALAGWRETACDEYLSGCKCSGTLTDLSSVIHETDRHLKCELRDPCSVLEALGNNEGSSYSTYLE